MTDDDDGRQSLQEATQSYFECPRCGARAEIIYGFGDGPQRGRLNCPECGVFEWPPRQC
jgi:transcription elongation factor Elf1